jgi:outer membrane lipoprotein-sorting protein
LGGDWEEVTGARTCPAVEFSFLCFFLAGVLPSVAAFAGATKGAASDVMAKAASVKSRMANLVMRFSCGLAEETPED